MNRAQLTNEVAKLLADKTEADRAIRKTFSAIADALRNGERVVISGFGTFSVRVRAARKDRNPKTGAVVMSGPRRTVKFKPSASLFS